MIKTRNVTFAPASRQVYGTPWSKLADIPISPNVLRELGKCLVRIISEESKKDFAKRGWSGKDPMGGPDIWDSFTYELLGQSTLVIKSTFYGMAELAKGDIPERKMVWLTQEGKDKKPGAYHRTPIEQKLQHPAAGRHSKGGRRPLIVPIKERSGQVVFRTAPLRLSDAWVHPGIAKFTFFERAIKKGREKCAEILAKEVGKQLAAGDPTR